MKTRKLRYGGGFFSNLKNKTKARFKAWDERQHQKAIKMEHDNKLYKMNRIFKEQIETGRYNNDDIIEKLNKLGLLNLEEMHFVNQAIDEVIIQIKNIIASSPRGNYRYDNQRMLKRFKRLKKQINKLPINNHGGKKRKTKRAKRKRRKRTRKKRTKSTRK